MCRNECWVSPAGKGGKPALTSFSSARSTAFLKTRFRALSFPSFFPLRVANTRSYRTTSRPASDLGQKGLADDFRADVEELIDAGDCVVAWCTLRGSPRDGGAMVELPEAHVWRFREGRAVEVREYRKRDEALQAAGLSEQDAHADS